MLKLVTTHPPKAAPPAASAYARRAPQERVFTRFVAALARGGGRCDDALFDRLWRNLRRSLCSEIRARGLWNLPPAYLGVFGHQRWIEAVDNDDDAGSDALDELLADCYAFIFVDRLRALADQLQRKPNIDGLVFLNIRHFLLDRQRRHDPVGFRTFEATQAAVRAAIAAGRLVVAAGPPRIANATLLAVPAASPDEVTRAMAHERQLAPLVRGWYAGLLPDLITARGPARTRLERRLGERIAALPEAGVAVFRFAEVLEPLKAEVRSAWAALLAEEPAAARDGAPAQPPAIQAFEQDQDFARLVACVSARLEALALPADTRAQLGTVWQQLVAASATGADPDREPPTRRQLARRLGVGRKKMGRLFDLLGDLIRRCQNELPEAPAERGAP